MVRQAHHPELVEGEGASLPAPPSVGTGAGRQGEIF